VTTLIPRKTVRTPGVEVITGIEHREEKENPRVGLEGHEQAQKLGLPGWVANLAHASPIRANHVVGVRHEKREDHADEGQNQESNLLKYEYLLTKTSNNIRMCRFRRSWPEGEVMGTFNDSER